jgi:hypothetical protein
VSSLPLLHPIAWPSGPPGGLALFWCSLTCEQSNGRTWPSAASAKQAQTVATISRHTAGATGWRPSSTVQTAAAGLGTASRCAGDATLPPPSSDHPLAGARPAGAILASTAFASAQFNFLAVSTPDSITQFALNLWPSLRPITRVYVPGFEDTAWCGVAQNGLEYCFGYHFALILIRMPIWNSAAKPAARRKKLAGIGFRGAIAVLVLCPTSNLHKYRASYTAWQTDVPRGLRFN